MVGAVFLDEFVATSGVDENSVAFGLKLADGFDHLLLGFFGVVDALKAGVFSDNSVEVEGVDTFFYTLFFHVRHSLS